MQLLQSPKCPSTLLHHHHQQSLNSSVFSTSNPSLHYLSSTKNKNKRRNLTVKCRRSEYIEPQQQRLNTNSSFIQQDSLGAFPSRVYVGYSIYKGKAALTIEPKAPEFSSLDSGAYKVSKEGIVLLQFAPAIGTRQYDWSRKQVFSLSISEIGTLMGLGGRDSCEFFHDPNKGKSDEGKVRKVLKAEPLPDGSGHFFNLSVQNKLMNVDESIYIPISKAEFTVMVSAFNYILPFLLGWHAFANSIKPEDSVRFNNANPRGGADVEWSR
ncbi:Single-stranded dna-binding protein why1 protein [Thalictrum thalictroides]|uniref:Single-stranded dna-binding protein why1 protein n=1 Tax=Thalictrum thalictroides TaxID=46969 RepID=A0A7J6X173_THATH|nr:Single-stranded dna-binding protein why1 protein [Thalictrum thalictroides]